MDTAYRSGWAKNLCKDYDFLDLMKYTCTFEIYLQYQQQHILFVALEISAVFLNAYADNRIPLLLPQKQELVD